jgi:antagonist of KipI
LNLEILEGGFGVTVQDAGRMGQGSLGIPESGAMDPYAFQVANILVGNDPGAAGLEIPSTGFIFRADTDYLLACTGPGWSLKANGKPLPGWTAVLARAGEPIDVNPGSSRWGYLAIAGGLAVPTVLASRSTYLRGGFGGFLGRTLQAGDLIPCFDAKTSLQDRAGIAFPMDHLPRYGSQLESRVIPGPESDSFPGALDEFIGQVWRVGNRSDRMGYALEGGSIQFAQPGDLITAPVIPGVIQLPPRGSPIVLMRDAQTTGGYARIAVVIGADLDLLAQLQPGDEVAFRKVSLEDARLTARERRKVLENFLYADSN